MRNRTVIAGIVSAWVLTLANMAVAADAIAPASHPTPGVEFVFQEIVTLGAPQLPGKTPYGERHNIPITGGTFEGPDIKGKVLPGGSDWQLVRADGTMTLDADYFIQTDDGAIIHVRNQGVASGKPGGDFYLRTTPVLEAPIGKYDWLNKFVFVGTVEEVAGRPGMAVCVRVFKVT